VAYRWGKDTTEQYHSVDIREAHFKRMLRCGGQVTIRWTRWEDKLTGVLVAERNGDSILLRYAYDPRLSDEWIISRKSRILLTSTRCNYGGRRLWFVCPGCGGRVAVLYGGRGLFACRRCYGLVYGSQREASDDRALRRAQTIRIRLGGSGNMFEMFPFKPKGMRWRTYARLRARFEEAAQESFRGTLARIGRL